MAVKKVNAKPEETKDVALEVETSVEAPEVETASEDGVEATVEPEVEVPEVEVETPVDTKDSIDVNTENAKVDTSNKPSGKVKIRMRVDHKCCIAMERYDLKAGKTYVVPENVKRILNKAGLLAPL